MTESEVAQSCLTLCDPWTVAHQAPPSMGFSRQEYWSGLPFPSPGDLPNPGIEPRSPTLQAEIKSLRKPPIVTQNFRSKYKHQRFQGRKGSQVERRRGGGVKGVALKTSPATYRYPGVMGLFPGPPEKGGLELSPTRDQTRTRIRVLCQEEVISLQSSAQAKGPSTRFLCPGLGD